MRLRDFHYIRRADRRAIFFLLMALVVVNLALLVFHGKEILYTSSADADSTTIDRGGDRNGYRKYKRGGVNRYYAVPGAR